MVISRLRASSIGPVPKAAPDRILLPIAVHPIPVETPGATINDFRHGKISRVRTHLDHGEALRAAGLSE
jgi:hypothetical protein